MPSECGMYRLNVLNLTLPALHEIPEDIIILSRLFVERAATQIGCEPPTLTNAAKDLLVTHPWPGNIRQLENLLFRTVALTKNNTIGPDELSLAGISTQENTKETEQESWKIAQAIFEKNLLTKFYKQYPSTRKLAKRLRVSHTTISEKLRAHNITQKRN